MMKSVNTYMESTEEAKRKATKYQILMVSKLLAEAFNQHPTIKSFRALSAACECATSTVARYINGTSYFRLNFKTLLKMCVGLECSKDDATKIMQAAGYDPYTNWNVKGNPLLYFEVAYDESLEGDIDLINQELLRLGLSPL